MELGVRDWMIIVGVLLIVAVLIDGFRRVRNERRGKIRMSLNKQFLNADDDYEPNNSELPSGGARRAGERLQNNAVTEPLENNEQSDSFSATELDLEQDVPMLMESVNAPPRENNYRQNHQQNSQQEQQPSADCSEVHQHLADSHDEFESLSDGDDVNSDSNSSAADADNVKCDNAASPVTESVGAWVPRSSVEKSQLTDIENKEVVVINVVAKDEYFKGPDLLQILLACDVRFGEMNIFHRHEKANGTGAVQFSVANSIEPGDFNLDTIDEFTTPGVCFFMSVPGPEKVIEAFDCLVETAQCLVKNLNGELRDESRSVMTAQTLEHCRARLFEFERRQLAQHA